MTRNVTTLKFRRKLQKKTPLCNFLKYKLPTINPRKYPQ